MPPELTDCKRMLESLARDCQVLILWLDCDREGEAIAFDVLEICRRQNPNLDIKRAQFSALTRQDLTRAARNLVLPNPHMKDAVAARQEIDLRIGSSFTRFMSLRY